MVKTDGIKLQSGTMTTSFITLKLCSFLLYHANAIENK